VALLALLRQKRRRDLVVALGLFGAALLYGDGVITPTISVLSAAEGFEVATPAFGPYVLPATLLILFLLFFFQKYGTARMGGVFGPIMLVWFATIATLGAVEIVREPSILHALNPWYGARFLLEHGVAGFLVLGSVVLAVTGAEALYADMGHFGRTPIRLAWFVIVFPALLLNYFGQGALVLRIPDAVQNPFYLLAARSFLYPLVVIATRATVVASQALISGAFSLTQQCVQLHYSPRVSIVHTSRSEVGQIYIPEVNTALMIGCLLLVLGFQSSRALGAAYGIAVTGTMTVTTVLFYVIARQRWHWSARWAGALAGAFLTIDLASFGANVIKIADGGWVPLAIGGGGFLLMNSWHRGTELFRGFLAQAAVPMDRFIDEVERAKPPRVHGTAIFLTPDVDGAPLVLQRHLRYTKALHEEVILLSIITEDIPEVEHDKRVTTEALPQGFHRVRAYYGFMERPDVQEIVAIGRSLGLKAEAEETTYYLGRTELLSTGRSSDDAVAEAAVQPHVAERECSDRLLQHPAKPCRRARRTHRVLRVGRVGSGVWSAISPSGSRAARRRSQPPRRCSGAWTPPLREFAFWSVGCPSARRSRSRRSRRGPPSPPRPSQSTRHRRSTSVRASTPRPGVRRRGRTSHLSVMAKGTRRARRSRPRASRAIPSA
jgi:KUP system potassium uptake protein